MHKATIITLLLFSCAVSNAQILRFNHIVSQDRIQEAGFTLNQPTAYAVRPAVQVMANYNHTLIANIADTIVTTIPLSIVSTKPFTIRSTLRNTASFTVFAGNNTPLLDNIDYMVQPGSTINIPANKTLYVSAVDNTTILQVSSAVAYTPNAVQIRAVSTTQVALIAPTKGIVSVSSGKIMFDPWQITSLPPAPMGSLISINANTGVPLELKDGRQTISTPTKVLRIPYRHYTVSVNSVPFRYRPRRVLGDSVHATGTVTTAFNLALSVGRTWGFSEVTSRARHDYAFTIGAFAGPSSADLKKETVKTPGEFTAGRTNPVLSYGLNAIFSRNGLGILLAAGLDDAFGKHGNNWIYDGQLWYGLGVSASFPK